MTTFLFRTQGFVDLSWNVRLLSFDFNSNESETRDFCHQRQDFDGFIYVILVCHVFTKNHGKFLNEKSVNVISAIISFYLLYFGEFFFLPNTFARSSKIRLRKQRWFQEFLFKNIWVPIDDVSVFMSSLHPLSMLDLTGVSKFIRYFNDITRGEGSKRGHLVTFPSPLVMVLGWKEEVLVGRWAIWRHYPAGVGSISSRCIFIGDYLYVSTRHIVFNHRPQFVKGNMTIRETGKST